MDKYALLISRYLDRQNLLSFALTCKSIHEKLSRLLRLRKGAKYFTKGDVGFYINYTDESVINNFTLFLVIVKFRWRKYYRKIRRLKKSIPRNLFIKVFVEYDNADFVKDSFVKDDITSYLRHNAGRNIRKAVMKKFDIVLDSKRRLVVLDIDSKNMSVEQLIKHGLLEQANEKVDLNGYDYKLAHLTHSSILYDLYEDHGILCSNYFKKITKVYDPKEAVLAVVNKAEVDFVMNGMVISNTSEFIDKNYSFEYLRDLFDYQRARFKYEHNLGLDVFDIEYIFVFNKQLALSLLKKVPKKDWDYIDLELIELYYA